MIDTHYRWVIVAAGGLLGCVAIGTMFSLPVLLRPISEDTGWSTTGVSTAMTIGFLALAFASMVWGGLSDRFGPRVVVVAGSALLAASTAVASQATSLIEFQLVFGLVVGAATAAEGGWEVSAARSKATRPINRASESERDITTFLRCYAEMIR